MLVKKLLFFVVLFASLTLSAQVGIGTTNPDASSLLEVQSTTKGLLTSRMTTAQRTAISSPANGLLVYDTDESAFYYYESAAWSRLKGAEKRDNYVLVKSQADLPAPSGSVITLDENTFYEINGTIALTASINLNGAYVSGLDATEDVLSYTGGTVFSGSTGGSIRNITITGARAFNISASVSESLLVQNTIVANTTTSVGTIANLGLFFGNIVQFLNNADGVTYTNIGNLLLNNQAWLSSNSGTFEKLSGTFGLVQKVSGFSTVSGSARAFDVSSNPTVGNGVLLSTVFSGTSSNTYVNRYTSGSYTGYNFTNNWTVNCPGIPVESDNVATSNLYFDSAPIVNLGSAAIKLPVSTLSTRMFRTSTGSVSNRVVYEGKKARALKIFGAISFTAIGGMRVTFSIRKNGVLVSGTEVVYDIINTNDRQGLSIIGTVDVNPADYIEIYVERNASSGSNQFLVTSYNLIVD